MNYGYGFDMGYLLIVVISMVLGVITQSYINSTYSKWSRVPVNTGETGAQVASRMLYTEGATDVGIKGTAGHLTDHYNPTDNNLYLSQENLAGGSVASVAVACHEAGHALQKACGYLPMQVRTSLVPLVNITSSTWMLVFLAGAMLGAASLTKVAVWLFAFSVLFHLVPLPVELDAPGRAVNYIDSCGLDATASRGAREVLRAAAFTYVAAALTSIFQFLYLQSRTRGSRR